MRKTTVECDAPDCDRTEQVRETPGISIFGSDDGTTPRGWVVIKVVKPVRSWPFGAQDRTFCSWHCVSSWGGYLDDTNGEGHRTELVDVDALGRLDQGDG